MDLKIEIPYSIDKHTAGPILRFTPVEVYHSLLKTDVFIFVFSTVHIVSATI